MAEWKKGVSVVGLVLIIVAVISWLVAWGMGGRGEPEWVEEERANRDIVMVDENDIDTVVTKTAGEWAELGQKGGKHKNPDTGQYSMISAAKCVYCETYIPYPQMTRDDLKGLSGQARNEKLKELDRTKFDMVCPKCQQRNPFNVPEP